MTGSGADILRLIRRCVEIAMPDLRKYYKMVKKAEIVQTYSSDGRYWADVQPLLNNETIDEKEPVIPKVEIPVIWGGPGRGIVCPPAAGTRCDLSYYEGDPDYPRISNFRWKEDDAPQCLEGGLIIQLEKGVSIAIDPEKNIIDLTSANRKTKTGQDKSEKIGGNKSVEAVGNWTIKAGNSATIESPQINLVGNLSSTGKGGGIGSSNEKSDKVHDGSYTLNGELQINGSVKVSGSINAGGNIIASGANSNHHSHP